MATRPQRTRLVVDFATLLPVVYHVTIFVVCIFCFPCLSKYTAPADHQELNRNQF